jgi:hypothetical protein
MSLRSEGGILTSVVERAALSTTANLRPTDRQNYWVLMATNDDLACSSHGRERSGTVARLRRLPDAKVILLDDKTQAIVRE